MGSIITGLIILMICLLPFVLMNRRHRKKEREFLKELHSKSDNKKAKISQYDSWSNAAIGIDVNSDVVFFTRKTADSNINQQVILRDVAQCKIERINSQESMRYKAIEKLELFFISK